MPKSESRHISSINSNESSTKSSSSGNSMSSTTTTVNGKPVRIVDMSTVSVAQAVAAAGGSTSHVKKNGSPPLTSKNSDNMLVKSSSEDKEALPSIKATQKDKSRSITAVLKQTKVLLLIEILHLLNLYKAHSDKNKYKQWSLLQDALERQPIGKQFKKMDRPYCFKKKVQVALDSWVDWAKSRGFPDPSVVKNTKSKGSMPEFLELLYKVFSESQDSISDKDDEFMEDELDEEGNADSDRYAGNNHAFRPPNGGKNSTNGFEGGGSVTSSYSENRGRNATKSPSSALDEDTHAAARSFKRRRNEINEERHVSEHDSPALVEFSATVSELCQDYDATTAEKIRASSTKAYVESVLELQRAKTNLAKLELQTKKARQEDEDVLRLEQLQEKIDDADTNSLIRSMYIKMRDRCVSRLDSEI